VTPLNNKKQEVKMVGLNERVKKLNFVDIGLIKVAVFCVTIIIVKYVPELLNLRILTLLLIAAACSVMPFYKYWIKK
jgi:hypothetical protein